MVSKVANPQPQPVPATENMWKLNVYFSHGRTFKAKTRPNEFVKSFKKFILVDEITGYEGK